ncbi:MAG: GNAT family N-acetyltransferase [Candidatus Limnocylindrales bacterium]
MDVRRIKPEDWPLLREMRLASLMDAPEAFGQRYENAASEPEAEWRSAARASSTGDRRAWFIARTGEGAAARHVGLVQSRRRPPADCLLFSMWVAPAARRSGAGRLLVNAVAAWAAGWGAKRVVLWVFGANEGALRFYERIGFRVLSEGPDVESGRSFGALAMELPL